ATVWLVFTVNPLSAALAVGAIAFYVLVYTYYLKRNTWQNIVIGGAAGAAPTLIGWAAVTGNLHSLQPIFLFLIVFWWTPPHFWPSATSGRGAGAARFVRSGCLPRRLHRRDMPAAHQRASATRRPRSVRRAGS